MCDSLEILTTSSGYFVKVLGSKPLGEISSKRKKSDTLKTDNRNDEITQLTKFVLLHSPIDARRYSLGAFNLFVA